MTETFPEEDDEFGQKIKSRAGKNFFSFSSFVYLEGLF